MSDELKAFCTDVRDRLNWLSEEVQRLVEENTALKLENQALREEATLARLYRDMEAPAAIEPPAATTLPHDAHRLFDQLPDTFRFGDFFDVAEESGIKSERAKDYMLLLLRARLLMQRGTRIEKAIDRSVLVRHGSC